MRSLFIYKYLGLGGVESVLSARLEGLPSHGVDAHAWFLRDGVGASLFEGLKDRVHIGGLHDLQRFLEEWRPNASVTIDTEEVFPVFKRIAWGTNVIVECHTPYPENQLYLRWVRDLSPAAILVPSRLQKRVVEGAIGTGIPVAVVPNPLSREFTGALRNIPSIGRRPLLCWVGRFDYLKNWTEYLRLCSTVARESTDARFWIVGDATGSEFPSMLLRRIAAEKIVDKVRWFRGVPHDKLPAFFDAVRTSGGVVVSTSRLESFGMAIAEAMARECACVVPDCGPFDEFVEDGVTGFRVKAGSVPLAAEKVLMLMEDREVRTGVGRRARESILRSHSPETALAAVAQILTNVVAKSPARAA